MANKIMQSITTIIDGAVHEYIHSIAACYSIDEQELIAMWSGGKPAAPAFRECTYVIRKGERANKPCGARVTKSNTEFCSTHAKIRNKKPQEKSDTSSIVVDKTTLADLEWKDDIDNEHLDFLVQNLSEHIHC